jgi:flavodoxin/ferredoxin
MKIHVICFSQTGNTRKVAKAMASVFSDAGHEVRRIAFRKLAHDDLLDADLIGMGAPSFESQAPTPVREFLNDLPSLEGRKAFVFSTSGGAPGRVLYDLAKPFQDRGVDVVGGFLCRGTCFHPVPCLVGRFPKRPDERDLKAAEDFAAALLEHLNSGRSGPMPGTRPDAHLHGFGFYQIIGAVLKDPLLRLLMPKPVADLQTCNECRWCVSECPTNSMRLDPLPVITNTCIRCYRCLTGCPEGALSVKWGLTNILVWSLYNTTFERWFGDIKPGEKCY